MGEQKGENKSKREEYILSRRRKSGRIRSGKIMRVMRKGKRGCGQVKLTYSEFIIVLGNIGILIFYRNTGGILSIKSRPFPTHINWKGDNKSGETNVFVDVFCWRLLGLKL